MTAHPHIISANDAQPLFVVVAPRSEDFLIGPLQLILEFFPEHNIQAAWITIRQQKLSGTIIAPHRFAFLLPPPDQPVITIGVQAQAAHAFWRVSFDWPCHLPTDTQPERPYEFRWARHTGLVLQREHIYSTGPPNQVPDRETLHRLQTFGRPPFLDVGCGVGAYLAALNHPQVHSRGLEVNPEYVQQAQQQGRAVQVFDGATLPFADDSFATVYAVEVLEHVPHWEALLNEMLRVSRWRVLLTTPNMSILADMARHGVVPWHILESTHVNFFTAEAWRHTILQKAGGRGFAETYNPLTLNGEFFDLQLWVCIEKSNQQW